MMKQPIHQRGSHGLLQAGLLHNVSGYSYIDVTDVNVKEQQ